MTRLPASEQQPANTDPSPIGTPEFAYGAVLAHLAKIGAKSVLDCPAGEGALAKQLCDAGYAVTCSDIAPDRFKLGNVPCDYADLNEHLPYADAQFDAITCLNGLHRIWARGRAISELARVLKPKGQLVLTFGNKNNLSHRLTFLLTGSIVPHTIGPPTVCPPDASNPAAFHRYDMTIAHVLSALRSVDLQVVSLRSISISFKSVLLAPLALLSLVFAPFAPREYQEQCFLDAASNPSVLFGRYLIVCAVKPDGDVPNPVEVRD